MALTLIKTYGARVALQPRRRDQTMTNLLVLVQYFGHTTAHGSTKSASEQFAARAFRVPALDGTGATVKKKAADARELAEAQAALTTP